jgi:hypothetical protein
MATARLIPEGQFLLNDVIITCKILVHCKIKSKKYGPIRWCGDIKAGKIILLLYLKLQPSELSTILHLGKY